MVAKIFFLLMIRYLANYSVLLALGFYTIFIIIMTSARLHQWETLVPTRSQNLITYALLHWVDLEG